jgi:phosphatidylinositol alpha-mannosyltransferase
MRIAIVCPYSLDEPGGVQQHVLGLRDGIVAAGHDAWLIAPGRSERPGVVTVGRAHRVRTNRSIANVALHPDSIGRTRRAVAGADVVHVHEPFLAPASPAAFLGAGPPAVGTFHADPSSWVRFLYRAGRSAWRRVIDQLAAVTAVSETARSAVDHLGREALLIPNAVDTAAFAIETERYATRVAFLGRDEPRKGLDVLLAAWPTVHEAVPSAELVVMGVERGSADQSIRFHGITGGAGKARQLASARIFSAPNLGGESFGISLLEAMAAGCAPVVSDLPAFRRVAAGAARYHAVGDAAGLAARLVESLRDGPGSEMRSREARRRAAAYDWREVLPRYLDLYERIAR